MVMTNVISTVVDSKRDGGGGEDVGYDGKLRMTRRGSKFNDE